MVFKGDLLKNLKLTGLSKQRSFELLLQALIKNVLLFSVNNIQYDPSEVINDLIHTIFPINTKTRTEFKYSLLYGNTKN